MHLVQIITSNMLSSRDDTRPYNLPYPSSYAQLLSCSLISLYDLWRRSGNYLPLSLRKKRSNQESTLVGRFTESDSIDWRLPKYFCVCLICSPERREKLLLQVLRLSTLTWHQGLIAPPGPLPWPLPLFPDRPDKIISDKRPRPYKVASTYYFIWKTRIRWPFKGTDTKTWKLSIIERCKTY